MRARVESEKDTFSLSGMMGISDGGSASVSFSVGPLWVDPLVQVHHNGVLGCDLPVEHAFHVPVRTKAFPNVATPPVSGENEQECKD